MFDALAYIAFAMPPITRVKSVDTHRRRIFAGYDEPLQHLIESVLAQYINDGVGELDRDKLPISLELKYNSECEAAQLLGGVACIRETFVVFQERLDTPPPD